MLLARKLQIEAKRCVFCHFVMFPDIGNPTFLKIRTIHNFWKC